MRVITESWFRRDFLACFFADFWKFKTKYKEDFLKYKIKGDSDYPIVEINLDRGKKVRIERGSMAYMSNTMIEGKMNGNKKGLSEHLER